jgi:hypothetical protein
MHPPDVKPPILDRVLDRGPIPADAPDSACLFRLQGFARQLRKVDGVPGTDRCVPQALDQVVGQGTTFAGMALVGMAR